MTNEELLQQYKDGDASALEQLYEQNVGLIKRTAEKCLMDFGYLSKDTTTPWKAASYVDELRQELCGEGALVFLNEIQSGTYDPSQGKLTTYLYPYKGCDVSLARETKKRDSSHGFCLRFDA